jgi:2-polyprenyl-3-methyl-5-hydroxy-6-metoxy-1,4-benzoquinol methylase
MSESVVPPEVLDHYERLYDESARITTGFGTLELVRTQEIITRVLPAGPLRILDVGGGPGVHARWLAEAGHEVVVVDPVPRHVEASAALADDDLAVTAQLGDARALPQEDATFDVVLLLGPLYHLLERDDRVRAWREARRVVKPGGLVVAATINRFASLFAGLAEGILITEFRTIVDGDLRNGEHRNPYGTARWFTTAYFHHPDEIEREVTDAGVSLMEIVGVEGIAVFLPQLAERWEDAAQRDTILDAARAVESEPSLRGLSAHLLVIARRTTA